MSWINTLLGGPSATALKNRVGALESQVETLRANGFSDFYASFGDETRDPLARMEFQHERRLNRAELEDLYEFSGLAASVVDIPIDDATRKGVDLKDGKDDLDDVEAALAELPIRDGLHGSPQGALLAINRAGKLGRLLGAGAVLVGVRDGRYPWEPIDERNIDLVEKVYIHHCHELWPHDYNPDGSVAVYALAPDGDGSSGVLRNQLVHASRVRWMPGVQLTPQRQSLRRGYPSPVLQRVIRALLRDEFVADQAARTTARKNIPVFRSKGLKAQVDRDNGKSLRKRLSIILRGMSILNMIPLDLEDEITHLDASLGGLADLLDRNPYRVSAASRIPMTRLFGMSPGGMNATGEHDEANYYDMVSGSIVVPHVLPCYVWLARLVMLSKQGPTRGQVPESFMAKPRPLKEQTEQEKADTAHTRAKTAQIVLKERVASREAIADELGYEAPPEAPPEPEDPPSPPSPGDGPTHEDQERANALLGAQLSTVRVHARPGDGSKLAVMIPARHLSPLLPDVEDPHVTMVYLPDTEGRTEEALAIIRAVVAERGRPFRCSLGRLDNLFTPDGQVAFYLPVYADRWTHEDLRERMTDALQDAGFAVSFPRCWIPHLTLKIEADPRASWTGTPPQSSWWVDTLEVWGVEEALEIPLQTIS